jgi:two-component system alkaline phosphatase synthesis response regulator PhoP
VSERILLVEDEELVGTMVQMNLAHEGYDVRWVRTGPDTLAAARESASDLILLDIGLPGADGITVLETLRDEGVGTPVLMLTARGDVATKVEALELGADDYLPKPFVVAVLLARVKALVRRSRARREVPSSQVVRFGGFEVNLATRAATSTRGRVTLSEKEAAFLGMLVRADGQTLRRSDTLDQVWGVDATPTERTVDNLVLHLRKLFEPDPDQPRHILTVRGVGYRFAP